jgi:hypothetical protein
VSLPSYTLTNASNRDTIDRAGADAGKTAHYMLRWVSTTAENGPCSETASATIEV